MNELAPRTGRLAQLRTSEQGMTSWKPEDFGPRWACPIGASGSQLELPETDKQKTPATLRRVVN